MSQPPPSLDELRAQISRMLDSLPPQTPIAAIVLFEVDKAHEDTFRRNIETLAQATKRLPGVEVFSYHKNVPNQPSAAGSGLEYLIYEDWDSVILFRAQWDSAHLRHFQYSVGALLVGPPDLRFFFGSSETTESPATQGTLRELTDTTFRFSWSLSLFGLQQMVNVFRPRKVADAFAGASTALERQLNGPLHDVFEAGQDLQRDVTNATFGTHNNGVSRGGKQSSSPEPPHGPTRKSPAGWGAVPYPVIVPGNAQGPAPETNISPDYPFEGRYVKIHGSQMHYVEAGSGDPILLLHGNPTWSYLWRNIIPHLAPLGRCIAPDLIGFGRSEKPDIEYGWFDHVRYLEGFIEKLMLKNITLVLHDHGSGLGFHYAMRHEENVKALAFFEAIIRPFPWDQFSSPEFRELFRRFRTGGVGGEGWQMIVEQNVFIEQLLPQAAGRPLTETEMNYYREPFRTELSRIPIWRFARETPIGGEPPSVWEAVSAYSEHLRESALPKLLLYATPGALITPEQLDWAKRNIKGLETVDVGKGFHFLQESSPSTIGKEIAGWIRNLGRRGVRRPSTTSLHGTSLANGPDPT